MLIFDAHLDLAMNALEWNRDLTRPADEIRARERRNDGQAGPRTRGTVSFPDMRRGRVGLCVATQIARYVAPDNPLPGWHSPEQAWAMTQGQLAWYGAMEERGELVQITERGRPQPARAALAGAGHAWGADWLCAEPGGRRLARHPHAPRAGLRREDCAPSDPPHYGPGVYAQGTNATGDLGAARPRAAARNGAAEGSSST